MEKRYIKFRQAIYHPVTNKFVRWHYWGLIDNHFVGIDTGWVSPKTAIENSFQFTGLHDKNGKKIYDKERLLHGGLILFVYWDAKDGQWKVKDKDKLLIEPLWKYAQVSESTENPELLEGQKK